MGTSRLSASTMIERLSQLPDNLELYTINIDSVGRRFTKWVVVGVADTGEVIQEFVEFLPFSETEWKTITDGDGVLEG